MGDFLSPKRRDVVDRLRRRLEFYRQHQDQTYQRYDYIADTIYEQQRQEAYLLRQKWLESKAKKSSKSKPKSDSSQADHRNVLVTKRLKHRLESNNNPESQQNAENVYQFDDNDSPPAKKAATNTNIEGQLSSVQVHIFQQISDGKTQQDQKINVTVSTSLKRSEHSQDQSSIHTNIECKQEPLSDSQGIGSHESGSSVNSGSDIILDPEFADILHTIEQDEELPQEIIDELTKFDEICKSVHVSESNDSMLSSDMFGGGTATGSPSVMPVSHAGMNMYMDPNSNMGPVRTPSVPQYRSQAHQPAISDTGPAAETLKQMAAQHQNQHTGAFGMKGSIMDPFALNDHLADSGQYRNQARNGFPPDYQQQQQQQHYPGISRSNYVPPMSYAQTKPHPYGGNKPLTHYPHDVVTPAAQDGPPQPSSLQQLQNQVAHFNQGPHMEITQTQHMQVSDGSHRMQMSQTQHVQMRQPVQNISLTQQQTFSMGIGQNQSQQYDPMNINMMQGKMAPDQRQSGQMPYMNRPPPEYKMQHSNGMGNTMSTNGLGPNPLETMQNMVNQTNTHANPAYAPVKSENSTMHMSNGMMQGGQMSGMQQMSNSMPVSSPMQNIVSQSQLSNYSGQAVQRQTSYPGTQPQSQGRPQRTVTQETYTSAIMRNQRPPNVNIGPDGLNISQPRNPHDWPRPMMPVQGPRGGGMGMPRPQMAMTAEMMRYRSYSSDGSMSATAAAAQIQMQQRPMQNMQSMPMGAMQSQAAMMQVGPQAQQMMMQQRMQMSHQQISQRPSHMAGNVSSVSSAMSGHPPTYPQSSTNDDIMTLLDGTAPNPSTDFFDVQTSGPNSDTNWMDLDDILGTPK